jgi:hypothetical protein
VPLQGHWDRVNTPLRETTSRERRIVLGFGVLVAIAVVAALVLFVANGSSSPETPPGCIRIEVGSTMGGGSTQLCGDTAATYCRGPAGRTVESKCREAGLAVTRQ